MEVKRFAWTIVLVVLALLLSSCAFSPYPDLKGTWKGTMILTSAETSVSANVKLEITEQNGREFKGTLGLYSVTGTVETDGSIEWTAVSGEYKMVVSGKVEGNRMTVSGEAYISGSYLGDVSFDLEKK